MTSEPVTTMPLAPIAPAAAAPVEKVPVRLGVAPTNLEEGYRLAKLFAESELVPKNFRGKPADVLVAIQLGIEVGLPPMQALQSIAVVNGRPTIWGDGLLALCMASPVYRDHDEYYEVDGERRDGLTAEDLLKPTTCAVCMFKRKGKDTPVIRQFTVAQARIAGLLGAKVGAGKDGPWQTYPDRMLAMRARGFAARDAFPDVLRGIISAEEAHDLPDEQAPTTPPQVRRLSAVVPPAAASDPDPARAPCDDMPRADEIFPK